MVALQQAIDVILKGLISTEWPDKDEETHLKEKDEKRETWMKPKK